MTALADPLAINQRVTLEVLDGPDRGKYPTRVEDVRPDALVLAAPLVNRSPLELAPATQVRLILESESFGVKTVETKVWESLPASRERRLPIIVLEREQRVEQIQRRADVRIEISLPVRFGILTAPEEEGAEAADMWPTLEATTADISAGGAQLITEVRLAPGTQIDVHTRLPDNGDSLQLVAEAVRILKSETRGGRTVHFVAIRWVGAEPQDRDAIVGFIFREQLRRRRRGIL